MKITSIIISLMLSTSAFSQDEKVYRDLFSKNKRDVSIKKAKEYKWTVKTPFYYLDLTENGLDESIGVEKKDGEDWIHFLDILKRPIKSFKFHATGSGSAIYRVQLRRISKNVKVIIVYYFEGINKTSEFFSSSRIYMITIDNNDLRTLSMFKGPYFLNEQEELPEHYHRRKFEVGLYDYNADGIREVFTKYHKIARVYSYLGNGKWISN